MRRAAVPLAVALVALLLAGLGSGTAVAGTTKLVEGTVYDTTCAVAGECGSPCPTPPCGGPIPVPGTRADFVCAQPQRRIVCPLAKEGGRAISPALADEADISPYFCLQGLLCGVSYPVYSGEGASVTVRKRGSSAIMATLPIVEGYFQSRLAPGEYVIRPYLPEPQCWSGLPATIRVTAKLHSPVPATVEVTNNCVAHSDAAR